MDRTEDAEIMDSLEVPRNDLEQDECITVYAHLLPHSKPRTVLARFLDAIPRTKLLHDTACHKQAPSMSWKLVCLPKNDMRLELRVGLVPVVAWN